MAGIRISGMASGLPPNIVEQIIEAEKIPVKQMETKKAVEDEKYKLVEELENKVNEIPKNLSELVGVRGFNNMKVNSADPNVIQGTADPNVAGAGSWMIEVERLAQKPGAISNGFPDSDKTQLGIGYLKFKTDKGVKSVYIDANSNTLTGVANAINKSGTGMRATVINDRKDKEMPFKILITGLATGDDNQVSFPTVYMLDGDQDFYFDVSKQAQNAVIKIDGFETEVPDNQVKDLIPGVTLDLRQSAPGREIAVSVKEDYETIAGKVKSFVDAYNGVLTFIQNQHKLQKGKDGREHLGPMGGDGLLRTVENNFRRLILSPQMGIDGSYHRVAELGIEFNRNGTLNYSQDKFNKALAADAQGVANFLRGDGFNTGFVPGVKREVNNLENGAYGGLAIRKKGLTTKIKDIDDRIDRKNKQLEKREEQLRQKFADLESQMSRLNSQSGVVAGMGQGKG
jgi:flagellar hook-associated protein 2